MKGWMERGRGEEKERGEERERRKEKERTGLESHIPTKDIFQTT